MTIPLEIRIGGVTYAVYLRNDLMDGDDPLRGHIKMDYCEILLERDMNPQMQLITLWHEVIHGILEAAGFSEHDEEIIRALGYGIVQVLRDNPDLRYNDAPD